MEDRDIVMVDTSAFYAMVAESDEFHSRAVGTFDYLQDRETEFWTTSYALVETIALVHRRLGFQMVAELLDFIEQNVNVLWVEDATHTSAMQEFTSRGGRGLSLVDWTLVLAARMKTAELFTFDGGISETGVAVVSTYYS